MINDSNFQRAHEQYLTPPEEPDIPECPDCDGEGIKHGLLETIPCPRCNGDGSLADEMAARQEQFEERKADEEEGLREDDEGWETDYPQCPKMEDFM